MSDEKERFLDDAIFQLSKFENEFLQSSKRIMEAGNNKLYALDLFALTVNNRALSLIKAFITLSKDKNYLSAVSLIRLQLDNALRFFASTLVKDSQDFMSHFIDGKEIRDYKDHKGKNLTDSYLAKELEKYFNGTSQLYKNTCAYIHLSDKHMPPTLNKIGKTEMKIGIRVGAFDNFVVDQKIDFVQTMIGVSKLTLIVVEQWKHEKNRLGEIYDKNQVFRK